jgi:dTDP-glucose 4,6-dehydratase
MASTHFERDWLPIEDICRAFYFLLERGVPGQDYNIGADNHRSNLALTKELLTLCGKDESYIEIVPDRKAHDCRYAVNSDKLKAMGFTLEHGFEDYLAYTVEWYKNNAG